MFEAILPISDREPIRRNLDRAQLLIWSLEHFWTDPSPLRLHIVVPDQEFSKIRSFLLSSLKSEKLSIQLIAESDLSNEIGSVSLGLGYAKQMLIKMACYKVINAPFCLVLDSDVVCCKDIHLQSFTSGSRAISDWIVPTMWEWWFESARVLGIDLRNEDLQRPRLGVTPQVLSTALLRRLTHHLDVLSDDGWIGGLLRNFSGDHPRVWTEYTLYDLFCSSNNALLRYHLAPSEISDSQQIQAKEQNVWSIDDYKTWEPEAALRADGRGHFMVLQSIIGGEVDFDQVRNRWLNALKV